MDAAKHRLKIPAVISPQMMALGPPLGRARFNEADNAVHVFKIANARPNIEIMLKLRFSSCLWPNAANVSASSTTLVCLLPGTLDRRRSGSMLLLLWLKP